MRCSRPAEDGESDELEEEVTGDDSLEGDEEREARTEVQTQGPVHQGPQGRPVQGVEEGEHHHVGGRVCPVEGGRHQIVHPLLHLFPGHLLAALHKAA